MQVATRALQTRFADANADVDAAAEADRMGGCGDARMSSPV